ncbi:MAG TPA: NUDIX domain-containing protein [Candidatus Limnocylindrales bacterium]
MTGVAERVLVVPARAVTTPGTWRGVTTDRLEAVLATIRDRGEFRPRADVEVDPTFKQIIPYLVLLDGRRYFLMRRSRAGVDRRLHDRWSIGVGGHLNPGDGDLDAGLRREWHEEIEADFVPRFRLVGLLNDDETEVGSVHLGVVFTADVGGRTVAVRETDKLEGRFVTAAAVEAVRDGLETWSALTFDFLEGRSG